MIETVIVSLYYPALEFSTDVELPADMPIDDAFTSILAALLEENYPSCFFNLSKLQLYYNGAELTSKDTLASKQIWDGYTLTISTE